MFTDPRTQPKPADRKLATRKTADLEELAQFHRLCRDGRLYDVERWIQSGRAIQPDFDAMSDPHRCPTTALKIGLEDRNHALVLLLLCNGYDPNLERYCPLDLVLRTRRLDLLDLLLEWGCDPERVNVGELLDTYNAGVWERFSALRIDLVADHAMAHALAEHANNKPLFGFAKRHLSEDPRIQVELNMALSHHIEEGNEKGALLCLWAGADPHAPALSLRYRDSIEDYEQDDQGRYLSSSAAYEACLKGNARILEKLKPDSTRDNFDDLYGGASSGSIIKCLARHSLPANAGSVIRSQLFRLEDTFFGRSCSTDTLEKLFEVGARWQTATPDEVAQTRRSLLKLSDSKFIEVVKLFATADHCSPDILKELARTPSMRDRMKRLGFLPSIARDQYRPTRSRDVLSKFGIEFRKPTPRLPRVVNIGRWRPGCKTIHLDRRALFEQVWTEPIEKLANPWGLSDGGLSKVCQRLWIPVPARGYWARVQHGQKLARPSLPSLQPGEAEEIVIRTTSQLNEQEQP